MEENSRKFFLLLLTAMSISASKAIFGISDCDQLFFRRRGIVASPSYSNPNNSKTSEACNWRIIASSDEKILLNITNLDTEKTPNCSTSYIEIRDGYWYNSPLLEKLCGTETLMDPFVSAGNGMLVSYVNRNPRRHRGFVANYEALCGTDLFVTNTTVIKSPNYPESYPNGKKCVWKIRVPDNGKVVLSFQSFDLEPQSSCLFDYVEVREENSLIGVYCGNSLPATIISSTSTVTVKFVSDATVRRTGFTATIQHEYDECSSGDHACAHECTNTIGSYQCSCRIGFELQTNGHGCEVSCGGVFNVSNGTITSPSYPDLYPANKTCVWEIVTAPFHFIILNFTDFELEEKNLKHPKGAQCDTDVVKIFDKNEDGLKLQGVYCGREIQRPIISKSNIIRVVFQSDPYIEKRGFAVDFLTDFDRCMVNNGNCRFGCVNSYESSSCVCSEGMNLQDNGWDCFNGDCKYEISFTSGYNAFSPNFPNNYYPNARCEWKFTTTPGHRIEIKSDNFKTEGGGNYDYLILYDGISSESTQLGKYYGQVVVNPVQSTTNQLFMTFHSDSDNQYSGFQMELSSICGGTFLATITEKYIYSHVTFGSSDYDNDTNCEWAIVSSGGDKIELQFVFFELEDSNNCKYDYVEVSNGENSEASIGKICGSSAPPKIISSGENVLVRFHTDGTVSKRGFALTYKSTNVSLTTQAY